MLQFYPATILKAGPFQACLRLFIEPEASPLAALAALPPQDEA